MKMLDEYLELQKRIHDHFGYVEDWRVIPLCDNRQYFWRLEGDGPGCVHYADTERELEQGVGHYYCDDIYTQRFLPKWVYRAADYTLVCSDPQVDGNKFLRVFDNSKERPRTR